MLDQFKDFIGQYVTLPPEDWDQISQEFERKQFRKNDFILEEGKICRHFYFFEEGLIRFFATIDGEDITRTFAIAPYCFTSKVSFRNQSPAKEGIQALENTVVWRIDFSQYKKLEQLNSWNIFMRKLLNEIQEFMEKQLFEAKVKTAEENYRLLYERYPAGLLQKIPQKHLATYLGIAPQSLSRIRNKIHYNIKS